MKTINNIENLVNKCTGCFACVDVCPTNAITDFIGSDGFAYTSIENDKCVKCGKCYSVCPIENLNKNTSVQYLYAAYSKKANVRNAGSSGGIFELLASYCIDKGYYVCGAAFENNTLKHRLINRKEDLPPLLKSKYIQSNTNGIYNKILNLLKNGKKVFFCGTPCQVSALKNIVPNKYHENLLLADIICHGVPSQKVFDMYIETLEKKYGGSVFNFSFRIKDNKYKHAHGYSFKLKKGNKVLVKNGIYTQSTFYNAFKKYLIFRESCYNCKYSTLNRTSDITLADFWGVEKYGFPGNVDEGVSMIITNSCKGFDIFNEIKPFTIYEEFPLQYGIDSNYCLTHSTVKPINRDSIIKDLPTKGYEYIANKYFKEGLISKIYWLVPSKIRKIIRKLRG
ncbi:MAG: Coenzyme F420 hydrogenase/dehydrogenase, beta subunit C-terminal domain [Bacilli bacterium]|nr:Coenzyme F420 hydrogenase/dehydrogenase, beta subunit C-terminal domain [Bacilli bacterium]